MCNTVFDGRKLEHDQQPESAPKISGSPQLEPWYDEFVLCFAVSCLLHDSSLMDFFKTLGGVLDLVFRGVISL